ncbi:MAG: dihydropteroate synthase [Actinomycetes bacterium]
MTVTTLGPATLPQLSLKLGQQRLDISTRAVVMGILNRTPDSFYDQGATFAFDAFLQKAESHVLSGADLLDVGGVKAGPGEEVSEAEELDRVVAAVAALVERFDVPISVDTWRASVAEACYAQGAVVGNDISGFRDPRYLEVAAAADATVIATHIRLKPRVADPSPVYKDLVGDIEAFLLERVQRALALGMKPDSIVIDAGLDLGKTAEQSAELLGASSRLASLGYPLLLSASNKTFLGVAFDLEVGDRAEASWSANAMGIWLGCRILRVHDVASTVQVRDSIEAILEAR